MRQKFLQYLNKKAEAKKGWRHKFFNSTKKVAPKVVPSSLRLNSSQLKSMNLLDGKNEIIFKVDGHNIQIQVDLYLWSADTKIVVSDIDGTITRSDALGHFYTLIGKDYTHFGVAQFFTRIVKNDYKILYLSSRPIGQSNFTKNYLKSVTQGQYKLPDGPVLLAPVGLIKALYNEVIIRRPEDFKIECLKIINGLFDKNPFVCGFGNKATDVKTYKALKIPDRKIYIINSKGQINLDYARSWDRYHNLNEYVDSMFPSKNNIFITDHRFGDFAYWKDRDSEESSEI